MKAIFHVSREQLKPDGLSITDKRFLEQLSTTLSRATEQYVCFRYTSPAEIQVIFELVAENIWNPMPVLVIEVEGQSHEDAHCYSIDLRQMTARLCVAIDQATDIATRLPGCQLVLRLYVEATINFSSLPR